MADVVEGDAHVAAVTAATVIKELESRRARGLAISSPKRLPGYASTPTWLGLTVDCTTGSWRVISGPRGLAPEDIAYRESVLSRAVAAPEWNAELERYFWRPMYTDGAAAPRLP